MPRYKCILEFDGTNFCGWQFQDGAPSVQKTIEDAVEKFAGESQRVTTAGRTDSGVHALALPVHFDMAKEMEGRNVMAALNYHLRGIPVKCLSAELVPDDFHARLSAKKRYYFYRIINRRAPLVLDEGRAWFVPTHLDEIKMQEAAVHILGKHDFTSFRDAECQAKSPIKTLDEVSVTRSGEEIRIYVAAKSFMHHMVRNITGTLKLVGEGKMTPDDIKKVLAAKDRRVAGQTAPAGGLYFYKVDY